MANNLQINSRFKELVDVNFIEEINIELAKKFLNSKWRNLNGLDIENKNIGYLKNYLKTFNKNSNTTIVSYRYSEYLKSFGRIYPKQQGLMLLPKSIRNALVEEICVDLDIKNAHPTFCYNLGSIYGIDLPSINEYVMNREQIISTLCISLQKSKGEIKEIVCAVLNGSENTYNHKFLKGIAEDSFRIYNNLKSHFPYLAEISKKDNTHGSFVSYLNQYIENNIMRIVVHFLKSKHLNIYSIIHDGCLVKTVERLDEILRDCNKFVKDNYYGFEIELVQKAFEVPKYQDLDEEETKITEDKLADYFVEFSAQNNNHYMYVEQDRQWFYCSLSNDFVWTQANIQYLYNQLLSESFFNFCQQQLGKGTCFDFRTKLGNLKGSKNIIQILQIKFMKESQLSFNQNQNYLSFRNGVYELNTNLFRKRVFDDFLSLYIDRDYTVTNDFTNQLAFMDSLFENVDTRDYVLKILATCILGKRVFEEFFVFSGVGSNGKSTLINILKETIKCYCSEIDPNFFCEKPKNSASPNPEIHESRYCRGLVMAEPEENSTFNASKIKQYTAKSIKTRTLFKNPIE